MKKTLIHTAFVAEAKPIIGYLKLTCKSKKPYNVYENEDIVLIATGAGAENTKSGLLYIQQRDTFKKYINFGIAGCVDKSIKIGTLFCTTHNLLDIKHTSISAFEKVLICKNGIKTLLVDMESEAFLTNTPNKHERYIFKVVSDYLMDKIPSKKDVHELVQNSLHHWIKYAKQ